MQLWDKILQLALLGSERTHLEPQQEDMLRQYRIDPEEPLPQVILAGAAALYQVRRLRIPAIAYEHALVEPVMDASDQQDLPLRSIEHLQQILSGRFRRALPEFVALLREKRFLLPPESLPDLLDQCLQDAALWNDLQPLFGSRAYWLITQHPQWRELSPEAESSGWTAAGPEERRLILIALRRREPERVIPLLNGIWENTGYRKKLIFLETLAIGLSLRDESFLEIALSDSRKEVRLKAADLLARLPGSQLTKRIFTALIPFFTFDKAKERLEVELPEAVPDSTAADGIQPNVKKGRSGGLRVSWLYECISRIPTVYWREHFDWETDELVRYFDSSGRADLLLSALGESALRFQDRELAAALLGYELEKHRAVPKEMDWKALSAFIPTNTFQELMTTAMQRQSGLLEERQLLTGLLELGLHPWNAFISRQIINGLKQWMAESKTFLWNLWHYKRLLEVAGYCIPVSLLDELVTDWPIQSPVWNQWAPDVERMLRTMRFRQEMREDLI